MHFKSVNNVYIKKDLEDLLMPFWCISIIEAKPKRGTGMGTSLQSSAGTILATLPRSAANIDTQTEVYVL